MGIAERRIEYETAGLDVADLAADPVEEWWRWYHQAEEAGCTEPNAAMLATVAEDGRPDCRYLLVRGADDHGFVFYTNLESVKAHQLRASPYAALTFGWLELHRQVRIRGPVEPVTMAESDAYFASRPRESQLGAWASRQSSVIPDRAALEQAVHEVTARFEGRQVPRPPYWGGYRLRPDDFEFWQGRPSRLHDRLRYFRQVDGSWVVERLSP